MNETNFKAIDDMIDSFKELYGENEPADYKAVVTLNNAQMSVIINALTINRNVIKSIDTMNAFDAALMAKENPTYDDKLQACFLAYALRIMKMVATEGDEVDG